MYIHLVDVCFNGRVIAWTSSTSKVKVLLFWTCVYVLKTYVYVTVNILIASSKINTYLKEVYIVVIVWRLIYKYHAYVLYCLHAISFLQWAQALTTYHTNTKIYVKIMLMSAKWNNMGTNRWQRDYRQENVFPLYSYQSILLGYMHLIVYVKWKVIVLVAGYHHGVLETQINSSVWHGSYP